MVMNTEFYFKTCVGVVNKDPVNQLKCCLCTGIYTPSCHHSAADLDLQRFPFFLLFVNVKADLKKYQFFKSTSTDCAYVH